MRPGKVEEITTTLRLRVQGHSYAPGDRLPPERELAASLGVARSTLRPALAALEEEGYLTKRLGSKGGWFVTDLDRPILEWREAMKANRHKVRDILDFRIAVEVRAAELAALRRTEEQVERMAEVVGLVALVLPPDTDRVSRDVAEKLRALDTVFHNLIADAAGSERLRAAIQSSRAELFATETRSTYKVIAAGQLRDHECILEAIREQDPQAAREAMEEHIQHGAEVWLAESFEGDSHEAECLSSCR
jgi:DNA-binding FadR family transcriptional regulator